MSKKPVDEGGSIKNTKLASTQDPNTHGKEHKDF